MTDAEKDALVMKFLSALFEADEDILIRLIDDKKRTDHYPKSITCKLSDLPSKFPDLRTYNQDGYGVFFVVNGGGHKDKDVKYAKAQFTESDDLPLAEQYEQIEAFPLKPSFLIQTKKSVHCYWKLEDGDIKRFREIQVKLAKYFSGDTTVQNEARCMRLPTFYHNKAEPVEVTLILFEPDRIYSQDDIEELLPEADALKAKMKPKFVLPEVIKDGHRQNTLMRYACQLLQRGYTEAEIRQKVLATNKQRCDHPLDEEQLDREVFPIIDRYEQGNKLDRFHTFNKKGHPIGIIDDYIVEHVKANNHLFVVNGKFFIYMHGVYVFDEKSVLTKDALKKLIYPSIVTANLIERVFKLLITDASIQKTMDQVNQYPDWIINFKNGMYDARTMELKEHNPKYFSINQIPHDYKPLKEVKYTTARKFINGIIPDKDDLNMFYQYVGYMFTKDTSLQKFLTLEGKGDVGKSTLLRLITKAIGSENISNLTLQKLNERFYPTNLLGKLVNLCADIPSTLMNQVDEIKMITGEDTIMGEFKGVDSFFFRSYAKLMFSANKMPRTHEDESGAYYRRLLIIRINHRGEFIPNLEAELEKEIEGFISLCMQALNEMYTVGFCESANSKNAVLDLRKVSDTVEAFLQDVCIRSSKDRAERKVLYSHYQRYCDYTGRQPKQPHNFYSSLSSKGFNVNYITAGKRYVKGLSVDFDKLALFNDQNY